MNDLWNYNGFLVVDIKMFVLLNVSFFLQVMYLMVSYRVFNNYVLVLQFFFILVYVCILFILGVIGNVLVCYVYKIKWKIKKKLFILFIFVLVGYDLVNCFVIMLFEMVLVCNYMFFDFLIVCKFLKFLIYGLNVVFIVIFLGIVIDRLLGI